MRPITRRGFKSVDQVLDWMDEIRADAERQLMTSLIERHEDFDDWDQVLGAIEDFREATAGWRDEARVVMLDSVAHARLD